MRYRLRTLLILLALGPPVSAQAEDRADAELDKNTSIECKDFPLKDVATYLSDRHGVPFSLGPGVKGDTPITCAFKDIKLRAALDGILGPQKLRFRVVAGTILIEPLANK